MSDDWQPLDEEFVNAVASSFEMIGVSPEVVELFQDHPDLAWQIADLRMGPSDRTGAWHAVISRYKSDPYDRAKMFVDISSIFGFHSHMNGRDFEDAPISPMLFTSHVHRLHQVSGTLAQLAEIAPEDLSLVVSNPEEREVLEVYVVRIFRTLGVDF